MNNKEQQLTESLQEAVLAVLAFDDRHGALISAQVQPEHFDGVYHEIAKAVIAYRSKFRKAPGRTHLEDLFTRAKLDPGDRKTANLRRTLVNLANIAEAVNAEYVVSRTQDHIRAQKLKTALLAANERYLQGGDDAVPEVEGILHTALRFRAETLDAGTYLSNVNKVLDHINREDEFFSLGIKQLDALGVGPKRKELLLYLAPKGTGKTWFCVHTGRQCLIQKARVVHISLEMSEERILARYYQSFFGIARKPDAFNQTMLELDGLDRLVTFKSRLTTPKLNFADPDISKHLRKKVSRWGARFGRLVVKGFPSGTLTVSQLQGYLDHLELTEKFIPDVLLVDYPRLMRQNSQDLRVSLGNTVVNLRGLADERNLALVAPSQSNRSGIRAKRVSSTNVSEDISTIFTADEVLSFSRTEAEEHLGLGRITLEHAREAASGAQVLISQSYPTGQYVTSSATLSGSAYWERLNEVSGEGASTSEE